MRKHGVWAVALVLLAVPSVHACYPNLSFGYRQFLPFSPTVAVQAIPAYYTVATSPQLTTVYATPGYYSAPVYSAPAATPCPQAPALQAPAPPPPGYTLQAPAPAPAMPYADTAYDLGANSVYSSAGFYRTRFYTPFGTASYYGASPFSSTSLAYLQYRLGLGVAVDRFGRVFPSSAFTRRFTGPGAVLGRAFVPGRASVNVFVPGTVGFRGRFR